MIILKIGGGKAINVEGIAKDLKGIDEKIIIVHGANAARDEIAKKMQTPVKTVTSVSGYSSVFSDENVIDMQMMAYAGLRNKRIVELLQQNGTNAIGLCGVDGAVIRGKRNAGIRVRENGKMKLLRDFSGKPQSVNKGMLEMLLNNNFTPVLTVPIIDEDNQAINSENDDIVALLTKTFSARWVVHFIEEAGMLAESSDKQSVMSSLSRSQLGQLEEKESGRFKRKLHAIKKLFDDGAQMVSICDGRTANPLKDALDKKGTVIS